MKKKILVGAAHADDEVLGCGGTITKHARDGDEVAVIFMTDGVSSRNDLNQSAERRAKASKNALTLMGVTETCCFDLPDNAMDSIPLLEIVKRIENFAKTCEETLMVCL